MDSPASAQYVTSLEEAFWAGLLVAITMAMHGFGMLMVLRVNGFLKERFKQSLSFAKHIGVLILASWMIIVVHLTEVTVWAAFFLWKGAFPNHSISFYFSLNEYTTLGSDYDLPLHWRLLEGMIATAGLLAFAWSTGVLLTLAQEFQDQQMLLLKQRREKRHPKATAAPVHSVEPS